MLALLLPFVTVGLFYKLGALADHGRMGGHRAALWAGLSVAVWVAALVLQPWGIFEGLVCQGTLLIAFFVGGTVWSLVAHGWAERWPTCASRYAVQPGRRIISIPWSW